MRHRLTKIYEGDLVTKITAGLMFVPIDVDGVIKEVHLEIGPHFGEWIFTGRHNGVVLWSGAERISIDGVSSTGAKTGLSVDVVQNDDFHLDLVQKGSGSLQSPVVLTLIIEDGLTVPVGGTTGQALVKASNDDYETEWASGGSASELSDLTDVDTTGVSNGDVLVYDDGSSMWVPGASSGGGVPAGGTTGQVLAKASDTDNDTEWVEQSGGGGGTDGWTIVTKNTNQAKTLNTTIADDDDLKFVMEPDSVYVVKLVVFVTSFTSAVGIKYLLNVSGGNPQVGHGRITFATSMTAASLANGGSTNYSVFSGATSNQLSTSAGSGYNVYNFEFTIKSHATDTTTLAFAWAQNASSASPTTVHQGSYLQYRKCV